jgi:hypothetical protein
VVEPDDEDAVLSAAEEELEALVVVAADDDELAAGVVVGAAVLAAEFPDTGPAPGTSEPCAEGSASRLSRGSGPVPAELPLCPEA